MKLKTILTGIIREIVTENTKTKRQIKEAKGLNLEQPYSNLFIKGWGFDINGNWRIVIGPPNEKGYSIQTNNPNLEQTNSITRHAKNTLTDDELDVIGQEITKYVQQFGSKLQKSKLKVYNNR